MCATAACAPSGGAASNLVEQRGAPVAAAQARLPVGAKVETSGYWSVETAPASAPEAKAPRGVGNGKTIYAEIAGVSNAEAARRMKAQAALRPAFEQLMRTLRTKERGNYVDAELIHRPDWAYRIYFKRDPAGTLAKYTRNARFEARRASYTGAELTRLTKSWIDRLTRERLTTGFGMNARLGRADIDMVVSREEFDAIARQRGWGSVPETVNLKFDAAPVGAAVEAGLARGIRLFAQGDRNLGLTNQAALGGRIVLRDGCFLVIGFDKTPQLAFFAREVGLYVDREGYLALRSRSGEPRHLGRIGEAFIWAGPIGTDERLPAVRLLRERCGAAPLMHVGAPDSSAMFNARYGLPRRPPPPPSPPKG